MSKILIDEATVKLLVSGLDYIRNIDTEVASQIKYGNAAQIIEEALAEQPAQRKPLPKGAWPKHPSPYVNDEYRGYLKSDLDDYAMQVLAAHGIKE